MLRGTLQHWWQLTGLLAQARKHRQQTRKAGLPPERQTQWRAFAHLHQSVERVLAQRLIDLMVVLWGVSALVFLMIRFIPGDAVQIMLGANVEITPERLAALYKKIGLDKSLIEQYASWIGGVLRGDFGTDMMINVVHASDSVENGRAEIARFFRPEEVFA